MPTVTVTASSGGAGASNGILLRVKVLTGVAAVQNGATAVQSSSASAAHQASITTTVTGSQVYGAMVSNTNTVFTANANTTIADNYGDSTNLEQYGTGRTTSATGTPGALSVGASAPSQGGGCALAEILPQGTIYEDPSAPAVAVNEAGTSVTTAGFIPPGGSLLVALVCADGGAGIETMTVSGGGVTWTEVSHANVSGANYAGVWVAVAPMPDPADPVITATQGGSTGPGMVLRILVLTGAAAVQSGASATGQPVGQVSITPNQTGSRVYGGAVGSNVVATPNAATTQFDSIQDSGNTGSYNTFKATATSVATVAETIGDTNATYVGVALYEVQQAGTLTEDASAPPVASTTTTTSLASANFTPPGGSLLVALIAADGGAGTVTMTVSGGGLTWVAKAEAHGGTQDYAGVWIAQVPPAPGAGLIQAWLPGYQPGGLPGLPGGEPFTPWQYPGPYNLVTTGQDVLNAAGTVTAAAAAVLDVSKAGVVPLPVYAPGWFPGAPAAPLGEPFTQWPLGETGVNSFALTAAQTITAASAAALTEAKPLNAATTVTATGAAAETTAKPLNAATTVTAAAAASLTVVKAGVTPAPDYPPAWFPSAPSAPGAEPFTPWPVWVGQGGVSTPVDVLNAPLTVTATGAAALTEAKPLNAATTITASRAAALTDARPVSAAVTATASLTAALTTAKPLNAAATVTASRAAALADIAGVQPPCAAPSLYAPSWFPGSPGTPSQEPFAPWPPWTGATAPGAPPFTIGVLTAGDSTTATLTAGTTATAVLTATTTPAGGLT